LKALLLLWPLLAREEEPRPPAPTYLREVKPILDARCAGCHAAKNLGEIDTSGGLALDSFPAAMKGGVIVPGRAKGSELVARLREKDPEERMPRKEAPLREEEIALIERWIEEERE